MSQARVVGEVVDGDDLDVGGAQRLLCFHGTEEVAADPAESVDAYPNGHCELLSYAVCWAIVWLPPLRQ